MNDTATIAPNATIAIGIAPMKPHVPSKPCVKNGVSAPPSHFPLDKPVTIKTTMAIARPIVRTELILPIAEISMMFSMPQSMTTPIAMIVPTLPSAGKLTLR